MFEELLNSLGLGNGKPTQQGKDALNNLLANTGTEVTYNELTQQEEGTNALNNLLANAAPTGTAPIQYTPIPQQPTALDNLLSQPIQTIGNFGKDLLGEAISNPIQTITNPIQTITNKLTTTALSFADKISGGGVTKIKEEAKTDAMDFGRRFLTLGAGLTNALSLGIDNTIDEIKYTNGTLNDSEKTDIQNYYNQNIDKYIAGEIDEKSFLDGVNKYTNQKGLLQGFKSVDDVAGLLNDTRANTNKAVVRNKDWNFLTDEQKGYDAKLSNQTKQDPTYTGFEQYFNDFAGKDQGINPAIKSNIRGGYEVLKSELEYSIQKQKSTLIAMENRGATEEEKQRYKEQSDKLINAQLVSSKSLLDDIQEAASKKADFDIFATEKYKDLGGIDGFIGNAIKESGVTGTLLNASNFADASDQLSSDAALGGFGDGFIGTKQSAVAAVGKLFEQSDKAVRAIQGGIGSDFSSAGLAGLSNVNFESGALYQKGVSSFIGEGATLVPDAVALFIPGGQWKVAGRLAKTGETLKSLNTASSVVNGLAYGVGGTIKGIDYALRGVSLAKDVATLSVLDEINAVGKIRGSKLLQGLSDAHLATLQNVAVKTGKVLPELAKDNAISALISRYTADAYGGQESKRWNDVYIDTAFNIFDVWGGLKQGAKALDGIKAFQSNLGKEVQETTGQLGAKSLSLKEAEKLGETLDSQFYAVKGILDKQTPEDFSTAYTKLTGKALTGEETVSAMNELKLKLAKNIIENVNTTSLLGGTTLEQLSKLKQIDEIVRDPNITPNGLVEFIRGNTGQAIARSQGLDAVQSSLVGRKISQSVKLSGDVLSQNSLKVNPNSLGETLGLTVPKINESEANRIEGILSSNNEKLDDYFTKQDDGNYILKEDKYQELGVIENKEGDDLIKKLYDNQIIDETTQTELSSLNAVDVLSKAIGNVLC